MDIRSLYATMLGRLSFFANTRTNNCFALHPKMCAVEFQEIECLIRSWIELSLDRDLKSLNSHFLR